MLNKCDLGRIQGQPETDVVKLDGRAAILPIIP